VSDDGLDVLVIGAGVVGLTTGICLAEVGQRVCIRAWLAPEQTTSAVAGALWGAHMVGRDDRVARWGGVTLSRLRELVQPGTGVRLIAGCEASTTPDSSPDDGQAGNGPPADGPAEDKHAGGRPALDGVRRCTPSELPPGYVSGWRYTAPVVAMPVYLRYLQDRFSRAGGLLETGHQFGSLDEVISSTAAPVIVNCTGAGASDLVPDPAVVPVRGQVVVVANPGINEFFVGDGAELTYLFPHEGTVVLGGTAEHGNSSREPDPATAQRILRDCTAVEPRLRGAEIIAHKVGLRPTRPTVRLAAEELAGGRRLVHNYGHGGAGVSLSWGCAAEAASLALAAPTPLPPEIS
jgi:D-amino-acid oxidase